MTELENSIVKAQEAYYNGTPTMSDGMFDELWDKLKRDQPDSDLLKSVGADHTDGFEKSKHLMTMGSQNKANTEDDMNEWIEKNTDGGVCIGQFKLDGASLELQYDNGKLIKAVTRGDGEIGDTITDNVLKMNHVIKELKTPLTASVRGEVLLSRVNKKNYFPDKANCRNAANGCMKKLDGSGCEYLDVVVYDIQTSDGKNTFGTQENLQKFLADNGFKVAEWKRFDKIDGKTCIEHLNSVFDKFDELEYDIDGIVWKQNAIDIEDFKNYRPSTNIALKPARTYATSTLRDVLWECKNGTYTPVAVFDPVQLNGTTVVHASLVNVMRMEQLGIEIGHEVTICKTGMIIPKIVKDNVTGKFAEGYEF